MKHALLIHLAFCSLTLSSTYAQSLQPVALHRAFPNLSFNRPVFLDHASDGSDRVFVTEQRGVISVFPNRNDIATAGLFLDISQRVNNGPNEAGLLSTAFHPQYESNGLFYVYYNHGNLFSRIAEFRVSSDPARADPDSERALLDIEQPAGNHNGGQIAFGPDGMLYIGLGDGGAANDLFQNGQDPTTLLGTILRIDVNTQHDGLAYGIPADNPFTGNADGWREEIWAWGLRNPWRFSFDRLTGDLWTGDVGQGNREEIDLIEKGGNYGWNTMEGFQCFRPATGCETEGLALPVVEYAHDEGRSVTGGYVYRGHRSAQLTGAYIYGDFETSLVWGLHYQNGEVTENTLLAKAPGGIASFGEDQAGELYILAFDGGIYTFEADPEPTAVALEETSQPTLFALEQNYPNPFNPQTTIRYTLPATAQAELSIYDITGQRLSTLVDGLQPAGTHQIRFDAVDLANGLYFYRLRAGDRIEARKMLLAK